MSTPAKNLPLFPAQLGIDLLGKDPFYFEKFIRKAGLHLVAGVDEAGRGPLAGPVVAAAVVLPEGTCLEGVRDSKQMSEPAREKAFWEIQETALATSIGVVSHEYIDSFDILRATLEAMRRAVLSLEPPPEYLLVDGIHKVPVGIPQRCLKKGDQISRSISAASVLAKVYRDRIMRAHHLCYPVYGFRQNKGYGTRRHLEALRFYGPCPIHRMTFRGVA